jgi:hypothetical protein
MAGPFAGPPGPSTRTLSRQDKRTRLHKGGHDDPGLNSATTSERHKSRQLIAENQNIRYSRPMSNPAQRLDQRYSTLAERKRGQEKTFVACSS